MEENIYDIIIIGAGTAGLSAAIYAARGGKQVLLLEQGAYGGQIINTPKVENYPGIAEISGVEFAGGLYEQAMALGTEFKNSKVTGIKPEDKLKRVLAGEEEYLCRSIIVATGAKNRPLGLEREEELLGCGVSYCATCDGAFFRGKPVAVVGGGNTALEDALFLSNYCERVYLIHRRNSFRGAEHTVERLRKKENVEFVLSSQVTALLGKELLEGIRVKNTETEAESELSVAGVFIAVGQVPASTVFAGTVALDSYGYIEAGEDCRTSEQGIFVAGDCRTKSVRQLTTAAADGAVAALAACEWCERSEGK